MFISLMVVIPNRLSFQDIIAFIICITEFWVYFYYLLLFTILSPFPQLAESLLEFYELMLQYKTLHFSALTYYGTLLDL